MTELRRDVPTGVVTGHYDERFAAVAEAFVANFTERGEVGASVCVVHEGETVVARTPTRWVVWIAVALTILWGVLPGSLLSVVADAFSL